MKDFTIGLVLALAESKVFVIDKPEEVLHAAIESAYEAIRGDVEKELHTSIHEAARDAFESDEIIRYALGARLMTREPPADRLGVRRNERFAQAYYQIKPTCADLYKKAAQAFIDYTG